MNNIKQIEIVYQTMAWRDTLMKTIITENKWLCVTFVRICGWSWHETGMGVILYGIHAGN